MLTPEEYFDLTAAKQLADDSMNDIDLIQTRLEAYVRQLITETYPEQLKTLQGDGFRKLVDRISRHTTSLAVEIDDIFFDDENSIT